MFLVISRGRKSLLEAGQLINAELGGAALSMKFDGLSSFGSRVVYAQVSDGLDTLHSIAGKNYCFSVFISFFVFLVLPFFCCYLFNTFRHIRIQ